jgi:histidine triad (HIT) family protein
LAVNANCVFCDIAAGKIQTPFIYEDEDVIAFADMRPIAPTHVLVIPRAHYDTLAHVATGSDAKSAALLGKLLQVAGALGRQLAQKDGGYRVVINNGPSAGQTVYHVHLHVLSGRHFAWPPG